MGRTKRQQVETIGTTTHKNKINHTKKQNGTTTHTNKKTSLKITNKTKQKGKTTHKKTTFYYLLIENMKNYILVEGGDFCRYYAPNKKSLVDFVRHYYKNSREYGSIDSLQNIEIFSITYNAKKIDIDNFFGDVIATEKRTGEGIDYDLYAKYGIAQKNEKKDFLYFSI